MNRKILTQTVKSIFLISLLPIGYTNLHAQRFYIRPALGGTKAFYSLNNRAPDLNIQKFTAWDISPGLEAGYQLTNKHALVGGFRVLSAAYGWTMLPTNFTFVSADASNQQNQYYLGYTYSNHIGNYYLPPDMDGSRSVEYKIGIGIAKNIQPTEEGMLGNPFLPGNSFSQRSADTIWVVGIESPKIIHRSTISVWLKTGLTYVRNQKEKWELSFVFNLGLMAMYKLETNNQHGNFRTNVITKEQQFTVTSKGTGIALILSYPIYFGKKK